MVLINKFQTLQNLPKQEETMTKDDWKTIKEAINSTCHEVLKPNQHNIKQ